MAIILFFQMVTTGPARAIDLAWDWVPGNSGYTSGPSGEIAYSIYMRTEDDPGHAYDYPLIRGADNCWWNRDHYTCRITVDHMFDSGVAYYFVAVAHIVDDPTIRSLPSNEIEYFVSSSDDEPTNDNELVNGAESADAGGTGGGSGGGGCFVGVNIRKE